MLNVMMDTWASFAQYQWNPVPFTLGNMFGPTGVPDSSAHTGRFLDQRFDADIGSLRYKLFVPRAYRGAPLPLIVMLHGCGQDANDFAYGTGMNELAEQFQCLIAYPEQSAGANSNKCWNWYEKAHHERGQGEPALIAGVTRKIIHEYAVDTSRVCVAGLSSGGAMAVICGRTYPDLFRAVGCHSGLAHGSARDRYGAMIAMRDGANMTSLPSTKAAASLPIIVFHGDVDSTVHHTNGDGVVRQSVDAYLARFGHRRDASLLRSHEETGHIGGRGFTRSVLHGPAGEVVVEQWTLHGTGHAWSGGTWRGSCTDTNGPDASKEMMRFFTSRAA
jgi:poly(hydroxyalkanoate) depolymerase family esterase